MSKNEEVNPFTKTSEVKAEVPAKAEEPKSIGRQVIDENTVQDSNWVNMPKKTEIGKATPELKIVEYYTQDGKMFNGPDGPFYSGLTTKDKETGAEIKNGEFVIEGIVDGEKTSMRLSNWEAVYKMKALTKFCRDSNFTLVNQIISFKRVAEGKSTAGENWELLVPSLKIVISGKESEIKQF